MSPQPYKIKAVHQTPFTTAQQDIYANTYHIDSVESRSKQRLRLSLFRSTYIYMLQSGLCLLHILRLRRLVYSLYTFMNNDVVSMTQFQGTLRKVINGCYPLPKISFQPQLWKSNPYHSVFLTYFGLRISYLPPYYLLAFLYQPRPVYSTAVSHHYSTQLGVILLRLSPNQPAFTQVISYPSALQHFAKVPGVYLFHHTRI